VMVSHGQFLVYNDGASVPEEAGTINRSGDVLFVGSDLTDGTIGVRIPERATQADFAGLWHFIGLHAGTVLTKPVKDGVSGETFSVEGHDAPIATDGTQTLLDVQRNETTLQTLSTMMNANGSGGIANLLWRGNGELEFSDFEFPLLTNASRDFAFGIGETEDKQSLMVGVRSPDSADASWLTGQWRFQSIWISKSHRMFENEQTGMQRWFLGNDDALAVAPGERLGWVDLAGRVEGWVETVTLEMAESVGIAPNGVFVSDGVSWHL